MAITWPRGQQGKIKGDLFSQTFQVEENDVPFSIFGSQVEIWPFCHIINLL